MYLKLPPLQTDKKLIHIFFDEVLHPALQNEDEYAGKLKKLMEINITNSTAYPCLHAPKWSDNGLVNALGQVTDLGYKHAVIWYDGTWPGTGEFEDEVINAIDTKWNQTDWLAAGHIINRHNQGDAPQWNEQCVIINLDALVPNDFKNQFQFFSNRLHTFHSEDWVYVSSKEDMHDNYTPLWVASEDAMLEAGYATRTLPVECSNGILNALFPVAFKNGLVIHNLDYNIRNEKICCYVEDDLEFTKSWFFDYDLNTRLTLDESRSFGYDKVSEDKRELFQYKVMDTHIMYVTNTEDVPYGEQLGIDTLVVPCSGLHQYKQISNNSDTIQRILWTDFSPFGIGWQEYVLKNWDGLNFPQFYEDNFHVIMDLGLPSKEFINYDEENALDFIDSYETEEEWLKQWAWIKTLDHQFVKIDVVKEWKRLAELIGHDHKALVQLSNIWQYEINYINSPAFNAQVAFVDLFNELLKNNKTIYFSGDTPGGIFYEEQNMRLLPGIV